MIKKSIDLDTDRVADAAKVLDVRTVKLASTVANPDEVGADIVPLVVRLF